MHRTRLPLGSNSEPQTEIGQVGNHFVRVHVCGRAGSSLIDVDRKVLIVLSAGHFIGCGNDRLGQRRFEFSKLLIG